MGFHLDLLEKTHAEFQSTHSAPVSREAFVLARAGVDPRGVGKVLASFEFTGTASEVVSLGSEHVITRIIIKVTGGTIIFSGTGIQFTDSSVDLPDLAIGMSVFSLEAGSGAPSGYVIVLGYKAASV